MLLHFLLFLDLLLKLLQQLSFRANQFLLQGFEVDVLVDVFPLLQLGKGLQFALSWLVVLQDLHVIHGNEVLLLGTVLALLSLPSPGSAQGLVLLLARQGLHSLVGGKALTLLVLFAGLHSLHLLDHLVGLRLGFFNLSLNVHQSVLKLLDFFDLFHFLSGLGPVVQASFRFQDRALALNSVVFLVGLDIFPAQCFHLFTSS